MYMYMYMADKISKKSTTSHFFTFTFTEYKWNLIVIALIIIIFFLLSYKQTWSLWQNNKQINIVMKYMYITNQWSVENLLDSECISFCQFQFQNLIKLQSVKEDWQKKLLKIIVVILFPPTLKYTLWLTLFTYKSLIDLFYYSEIGTCLFLIHLLTVDIVFSPYFNSRDLLDNKSDIHINPLDNELHCTPSFNLKESKVILTRFG